MHLITSGCSFSEVETGNLNTWPRVVEWRLKEKYDVTCDHQGLGSQGNGLIAKRAMYAVHDALEKGINPEEILVGIMWSGQQRGEIYIENNRSLDEIKSMKALENWDRNPVQVPEHDERGAWVILNSHWKNKYVKPYYFDTNPGQQAIRTFDNIVYTQLFLQYYNIKYFMSCYMDDVLNDVEEHPGVMWIKNRVDFEKWLPVPGMYEWAKTTDLPFDHDGFHPSNIQHQVYTDTVIMPWLEETYGY